MFTRWLEEKFFVDIAQSVINYVEPADPRSAEGLVVDIYQQMHNDFQLAPPISVHSPLPTLFAGAWMIWRESLVAGPVDRAARHTVGAAVSQINKCPFCVQANSVFLFGSHEHQVATAFLNENRSLHGQSYLQAVREWGLANLNPEAEIIRYPPFSPEDAPEIIGTALTFHYIDRMSDVFLDPSPMPLPRWLRRFENMALKLSGFVFGRRIVELDIQPGLSLNFLQEVPVPDEFRWANSKPAVAQAFARFSAVLEKVAEARIPSVVRQRTEVSIESWHGEAPGLSRSWIEEHVAGLTKSEQAAVRLTLLTALAPYQVDAKIVNGFRQYYPNDQDLIAAAAWASFAATRRVGSWLKLPNNL